METLTLYVLGAVLAVASFALWLAYRKGGKDTERKILLKTAEECAKAAIKVAEAARKAKEKCEKLGPNTSVDDGNKLLFGAGDRKAK